MAEFIIGLTGGIGSGKTAASDYFATLGIDVVDADVIAHQLSQKDSAMLKQLRNHFGDWVIDNDGHYNRSAMRKHLLNHSQALEALNQITHPIIRATIKEQLAQSTSVYTILSIPLLFENIHQPDNLLSLCQHLLVIDVDEKTQLARASKRDKCQTAQIQAMINRQISRQARLQLAKKLHADVIDNSKDLKTLHQQLYQQHQIYLQKARHQAILNKN